jgi:4-diphosphocytidyl-2-C-methyl-D-erythritol kinase
MVVTALEKQSPCKLNLLLNILGKRPDGFHELETVMHPVKVFDHLSFSRAPRGITLTCNNPALPTDSRNLVYRAADRFLRAAEISDGVRLRLTKNIPVAAGLGGGSGNAAITLIGLNEIFGEPLRPEQLQAIAASLGSDIPFFLQTRPALGTGRGEQIESLPAFRALEGAFFLLIHPGFGISTAWAYQHLGRFQDAIDGRPGRAKKLIELLQTPDLKSAGATLYNSLEAPALEKHPLLALFQEFLKANGAAGALMSGSGSTTFAIVTSEKAAADLAERFKSKFGSSNWLAVVPA